MSEESRKILILWSGMVAPRALCRIPRPPLRAHLDQHAELFATAEHLASQFPRTKAIRLDVSSPNDLDISKTQVVTTSYVSEAIRSLDTSAKEAGITVLNEVGVDPGVDHCYAIKKKDEVHAKGGKVLEFHSYCGGLPAPKCADNPLGFKFSWSPREALLSQRNSARFLKDGAVVEISSNEPMSKAEPYDVMDGYDFVAYPNGDSVPFREFYKIPEAQTVIRGSLRYKGNPAYVQALANPGWLEQDKKDWLKEGMSWAEVQQQLLNASAADEKYH
ncbi:hypothetical protein MMC29_000303 [Sticta canariensis]|nr:hypothetical protein [Sticta canariensis]